MLQLILGRASSGKTETIYNLAIEDNADDTIIIVPEQFTFETERNLLNKGYGNYNVLSFTRLVETTKNIYGGTAGDTLSGFDKVIIMLRTLNNVKENLNIYKNYVDSIDFANKLVGLNDEFKESAVTIDALKNSVNSIKLSTTKIKVKEIVEIFLEYNSIIESSFLDPADNLQRLYDVVNKNKFFSGKNIYLDGFKSFSNAQIKILRCMLRDANKVIISFCCDADDYINRNRKIFYNIYKIIDKILYEANSVGCKTQAPILLKNSFYKTDDLKNFEKHVFENDNYVFDDNTENIGLMHSNSSSDMIDNVLNLIHKLVRTEGYKYNDFIIVARDINKYDRYLSAYSDKYDIPLFFDKRKSLKYSPISRFVMSALNSAINLKSDNIFEYLKCGLNIIDANDLTMLEDYVYLWKINGEKWLEEWTMSVKGLDPYKNNDDKEKCLLKLNKINEIKGSVIKPIINLKNSLSFNSALNCEAIYKFINESNLNKLLSQYVYDLEKTNNFKEADYCRASFDPFIEVLSSLHKCLKNYNLSPSKFSELLLHSLTEKTVGTIPQMIDEVSCGSADRVRPARPKIAFVIGLNQYEFPAMVLDNDLLLNNDRKALIECNIDIVDKFVTYMHNENFLLYSTSCCSSEKVFLCSCSNSGESMQSSIISNVKRVFPKCKFIDFSNIENRIETAKNSFSILAELNPKESEKYLSLYNYYKDTEYSNILEYLSTGIEINDAKLSKEFALKHFNKDINMSASRVDSFYKCKFNYFCKYVLYLSKKKTAEIDVLNRGTIVHYVLESSINEYGISLSELSNKEIIVVVDKYLKEYLEKMEALDLLQDNRFKFIFNKIALLTQKTMFRIADEFKNTDFKPVYCECSIGDDVAPLEIKGKNKITISGFIDRVDIFDSRIKEEKYVRIVDYKSGNLKININNILYGLNLQMLIYLYAFVKNDMKYKATPAGIFYLPVNGGYNKENPNMKMSGILPNDNFLYDALDRSGEYIPNFATDNKRKENPQINIEDFNTLFKFIDYKIIEMESEILNGNFDASPIENGNQSACTYCDFKSICRIENNEKIRKVDTSKDTNEALEYMRGRNYEI